ncbi:extracellular tyrosine-protein kinase PKDCC-like isoform X2 [Ruditapes philippinarum]|nr:extracellular tyrosine-protein kinase PKDCC-like isoform X2 [Ruditapes philippinarum]
MRSYAIYNRFHKYYIVFPLIIYACLMYRMLENTCGKKKMAFDETSYKSYNDPTSRKIMQLYGNGTEKLFEIVQDYRYIEQKKKEVFQSLKQFISRADFDISRENSLNEILSLINRKDQSNIRKTRSTVNNEDTSYYIKRPIYMINCSNIHEIKLKNKIGHGVSKQTFEGEFNGIPVAVKMVTRHQSEVKACVNKINEGHEKKEELRSRCFVFPTMKLMKEILLLEQISHPGFAKLLGYCVRNEDSETTDLTERGIASVFELGERVMVYNLQTLTWQNRLRLGQELADFLNYLEYSPLGSLRIRDFKEEHFLLYNNSLKMIDLDDVDNLEPVCSIYVSADTQAELAKSGKSNGCGFNLTCQRGLCAGFNAKQNMKFMNQLFFKKLLYPTIFPKLISQEMGFLLADIDSYRVTGAGIAQKLLKLRDILQ